MIDLFFQLRTMQRVTWTNQRLFFQCLLCPFIISRSALAKSKSQKTYLDALHARLETTTVPLTEGRLLSVVVFPISRFPSAICKGIAELQATKASTKKRGIRY
jgi:hypothetical protein